jgi:hypothetical protein
MRGIPLCAAVAMLGLSCTQDAPARTFAPMSQLTIVYHDGVRADQTWHLTCEPSGGDHPAPEAACQVLKNVSQRRFRVRDEDCAMISGGPQRASISGSWRGQPISLHVGRANGCQIQRWDGLAGLFPAMKP